MTYERFSQLWDALVTNRPKAPDDWPATPGMSDATARALIAYAKDDKTEVNAVRVALGHAVK